MLFYLRGLKRILDTPGHRELVVAFFVASKCGDIEWNVKKVKCIISAYECMYPVVSHKTYHVSTLDNAVLCAGKP